MLRLYGCFNLLYSLKHLAKENVCTDYIYRLLHTLHYVTQLAACIASELGEGKESEEKKKRAGMAKDFDLQLPVIYVMSK